MFIVLRHLGSVYMDVEDPRRVSRGNLPVLIITHFNIYNDVYIIDEVTLAPWFALPTWGPLPLCKQTL